MKSLARCINIKSVGGFLAIAMLLLVSASPAQAVNWSRPSKTDNWYGSSTPNYPVPRATQYPNGWVKDGTAFYMHCYTDHSYFSGNYGSSRWFYGYNGYWGYVHSSYVFNQISVPRC